MDVPSGRGGAGEFAARVNTAADLIAGGVSTFESITVLAGRFGVSTRQARRYVDRARATGPVAVPERTVVFTVKLPRSVAIRVRTRAHETQTTISALVTDALTSYLDINHRPSSRP